jgi:hypothetical protein
MVQIMVQTITNLGEGFMLNNPWSEAHDTFYETNILPDFEYLGIPLVLAAGNDGPEKKLQSFTPQRVSSRIEKVSHIPKCLFWSSSTPEKKLAEVLNCKLESVSILMYSSSVELIQELS